MRKFILIVVLIIVVAIAIIIYVYSKKVDTKYAIEYAQVFGSYDIKKVDQYLNEDTLITYGGVTETYKNLRDNVVVAFEEKQYEMPNDSSYGHGDDHFVNGVQTIGIQAYINSGEYFSEFVSMEIERHWIVFYNIKSLTSSDDFFGYLFFGIKK
jgi:uncharacterized membrane protein